MAKEIFDVTLFNEFTITCGKEKAIITEYLGKQLVNLFQVFLYNRCTKIRLSKFYGRKAIIR